MNLCIPPGLGAPGPGGFPGPAICLGKAAGLHAIVYPLPTELTTCWRLSSTDPSWELFQLTPKEITTPGALTISPNVCADVVDVIHKDQRSEKDVADKMSLYQKKKRQFDVQLEKQEIGPQTLPCGFNIQDVLFCHMHNNYRRSRSQGNS